MTIYAKTEQQRNSISPPMNLISMNEANRLPKHVAIIPDGNRRWARQKGMNADSGHQQGFLKVAPEILKTIWKKDIRVSTLWMFSPENWKRSKDEVEHLMTIYRTFIELMLEEAIELDVKIKMIGRRSKIPKFLLDAVINAEQKTSHATKHTFQMAIDCGAITDLANLAHKIVDMGIDSSQPTEFLEEKLKSIKTSTTDPDLVIRTSGTSRLSGFLPLQTAYSELYFCDEHFPDMNTNTLDRALSFYQQQARRYGA